ncbi:MobV family relaxase [Bacillaceae bacterium S4-13-56]
MSFSIYRLSKVANAVDTRGLQRHNQRENKKESYANKDIDHSKTHLNYDLINSEKIQYINKIDERIKEGYKGSRSIRSDAIKLVDGLLTSDNQFFDRLSPERQKQFFKDNLDFIKKEYGEENVIYATVHLDEKTPHMHFGFVPLTEDGRLSAKEMVGNKKALSELQDRYNHFLNERGYGLDRGEKGSNAEHLEMQKFKEKMLNDQIQKLETEAQLREQNLQKIREIDKEIKRVEDLKAKEGKFSNKVTLEKEDFETIKNTALKGIATREEVEALKESVQQLKSEKKLVTKDRDYYREQGRKFEKENLELRTENQALKKQVQNWADYTKTFLAQLMERAKMLPKEWFNKIHKEVIQPSHKIARDELESKNSLVKVNEFEKE